jgi:hypothetical protein
MPVGMRQPRLRIERQREMQQRVVLIVAADAAAIDNRRDPKLLQLGRGTDA